MFLDLLFCLLPKSLDSGLHYCSDIPPILPLNHLSSLPSIRLGWKISLFLDQIYRHWPNCPCRHLQDSPFCLCKYVFTIAMFEAIFYGSLVKSRGGIPERSKTVGSVLTKSAFEIGSTTIKNFSIAFLHPIPEDSYKSISI